MKTILAFIISLIAASSFALNIATTDKKFFQDCEIKAEEKDGVRIMHRDGSAFLDFDTLPIALQKQYGWTAEKSAARKAERAAEAERQRIAGENARRASEEKAAADAKLKADKAAAIARAEVQDREREKAQQTRVVTEVEAKHKADVEKAESVWGLPRSLLMGVGIAFSICWFLIMVYAFMRKPTPQMTSIKTGAGNAPSVVQTIELTGKKWKVAMLLAFLAVPVGFAYVFIFPPLGFGLMVGGLLAFILAMGGAWWNHG